jgi:hypothetical protein
LFSSPSYCHYKYQPETVTSISGIQDQQASSSVCNNEEYDCEYQDGRHVPIFGEEVYKVLTTLEDASLQPRYEFSVFTATYSHQPSQAAIKEVQKNIQKLWKMVGQLRKLFEEINKSNTD